MLGWPSLHRRSLENLPNDRFTRLVIDELPWRAVADGYRTRDRTVGRISARGTNHRNRRGTSRLKLDRRSNAGESLQPQRRRRLLVDQKHAIQCHAILRHPHLSLKARCSGREYPLESSGINLVKHPERISDGELKQFLTGDGKSFAHAINFSTLISYSTRPNACIQSIQHIFAPWQRTRATNTGNDHITRNRHTALINASPPTNSGGVGCTQLFKQRLHRPSQKPDSTHRTSDGAENSPIARLGDPSTTRLATPLKLTELGQPAAQCALDRPQRRVQLRRDLTQTEAL